MENIKKKFEEPGTRPVLFASELLHSKIFLPTYKMNLKILSAFLTNPLTRSENSVNFSL